MQLLVRRHSRFRNIKEMHHTGHNITQIPVNQTQQILGSCQQTGQIRMTISNHSKQYQSIQQHHNKQHQPTQRSLHKQNQVSREDQDPHLVALVTHQVMTARNQNQQVDQNPKAMRATKKAAVSQTETKL